LYLVNLIKWRVVEILIIIFSLLVLAPIRFILIVRVQRNAVISLVFIDDLLLLKFFRCLVFSLQLFLVNLSDFHRSLAQEAERLDNINEVGLHRCWYRLGADKPGQAENELFHFKVLRHFIDLAEHKLKEVSRGVLLIKLVDGAFTVIPEAHQ